MRRQNQYHRISQNWCFLQTLTSPKTNNSSGLIRKQNKFKSSKDNTFSTTFSIKRHNQPFKKFQIQTNCSEQIIPKKSLKRYYTSQTQNQIQAIEMKKNQYRYQNMMNENLSQFHPKKEIKYIKSVPIEVSQSLKIFQQNQFGNQFLKFGLLSGKTLKTNEASKTIRKISIFDHQKNQ